MYGHLVPCRGGKSIPLNKKTLSLGKREGNGSADAPGKTHFCEFSLHKKKGWTLKSMNNGVEIRVNGHPIEETTLKTGDLIAIGKLRYRLQLSDHEESTPPNGDRSKRTGVLSIFGFSRKTNETEEPVGPPILGVLVPSRGGKALPLRKARNTVGRDQQCDVVITDKTVSMLHCGLEYTQGYWRVVDLGSTNGVMVNGIAYQQKWLLPGEEIMISLNRYRMEYQPQGEKPEDDDVPYTGRTLTDIAGIGEEETNRIYERQKSLEDRLFGEKKRTETDPDFVDDEEMEPSSQAPKEIE